MIGIYAARHTTLKSDNRSHGQQQLILCNQVSINYIFAVRCVHLRIRLEKPVCGITYDKHNASTKSKYQRHNKKTNANL